MGQRLQSASSDANRPHPLQFQRSKRARIVLRGLCGHHSGKACDGSRSNCKTMSPTANENDGKGLQSDHGKRRQHQENNGEQRKQRGDKDEVDDSRGQRDGRVAAETTEIPHHSPLIPSPSARQQQLLRKK